MKQGSVFQRHRDTCPRDGQGRIKPHKCHGPWSYSVFLGRGPGGKRQMLSKSGYPTKGAAQVALKEVLAREDAELAEVRGLTVGVYLHQWLDGKRALRPTTRHSYASHIRLYLEPYLGTIKLANLRPQHLDRMYSALLGTSTGQRKTATVRRVHATLRAALNAAVRRRLIPWNPALHVELPSADHPGTVVWTPEQLGSFLDAVSEHRLYPLFHLVAVAGLRRGEVLGLRWRDVDFGQGLLHVRQQLVDSGHGLVFGPPKTRTGARAIPLDASTIQVLRDHAGRQRDEQRAWGRAWIDRGLVFTREDGEVLRPDFLTHLFQRLATDAGLPRIRFHDLRHTSASLALAAGVPMKVVSHRLGHSSTAITSDLYTHVVPTVSRDAADRIAQAIPRRPRVAPASSEYCGSTADDYREDSEEGP